MKKLLFTLILAMGLTLGFSIFTISIVEAFPAETIRDTGCAVRDADGVQSFDADCKVHITIKYDNDGDLQFVQYQDKGTLPAGAPRPSKAMRVDTFFGCDGCIFEGVYTETVTPSGKYTSYGPN